MNDECLQRKIDLCNELLEIAEVLEPGYSRFRGNLLYDLQAAMAVQAKCEYENEKITKNAAKVKIILYNLNYFSIISNSYRILY